MATFTSVTNGNWTSGAVINKSSDFYLQIKMAVTA
jgi:hypothetical protein